MTQQPIPRILSIAGTDPTGGAGIHADLKSISANGGYGMAAVTAIVAQNTRGVRSIHIPTIETLSAQLHAVSDDVHIDAVKIGMLPTPEIIHTVQEWLHHANPPTVVLDPVMVTTSGDHLTSHDTHQALCTLIPHTQLITPNIPELAALTNNPIAHHWNDVLTQAQQLATRYQVRVLAKGGHLKSPHAPDALITVTPTGTTITQYPGLRIPTSNTHGTGCSLSAALATHYAIHRDWNIAVTNTKQWLTHSLHHANQLAVGHGPGPIHHFAELWQRTPTQIPPHRLPSSP